MIDKKSSENEIESLRKYQTSLQTYALKETDFNLYDEYSMPCIDDIKVRAELDSRIKQYYPLGIKENLTLSVNIKDIALYSSNKTRKFISEILNAKEDSITTGEIAEIKSEENSVNNYPLKQLALNYL